MGKKGAVTSKYQLSEELLNCFCACKEMLKVEQIAICSETDVDAIREVLFCLMGEQGGGCDAPLLTLF